MQDINFIKATAENYNRRRITPNDANNIYFITDTQQLIIGNMKFGSAYITVDNDHPLPNIGVEGYLYIDKRNNSVSIKVWDKSANSYIELPIADKSYLKSIKRVDQSIVGVSGTGEDTSSASLDNSLTYNDIDTLFDNN